MGLGTAQRQLEMIAVAAHGPGAYHQSFRHGQNRRRVARAERGQLLQLPGQLLGDVAQRHFQINPRFRNQIGRPQHRGRRGVEPAAQLGHHVPAHGEPRRHLVSAELLQHVRAAPQVLEQVEALDAAAGAFAHIAVVADDNRRPGVPLHQAQATMPMTPGCQPSPSTTSSGTACPLLDAGQGLPQNVGLHPAPGLVLRVQLLGQAAPRQDHP